MRSVKAFVIALVLSLVVFGIIVYTAFNSDFFDKYTNPTFGSQTEEESEPPAVPGGTDITNPETQTGGVSFLFVSTKEQIIVYGDPDKVNKKEEETTKKESDTEAESKKDDSNESESDKQNGETSEDEPEKDSNAYLEIRRTVPDSLVLVRIDRKTKTYMFTSISPNTVVNQTTNRTITDMFVQNGSSNMIDCVFALTGIRADFLSIIKIDDYQKLFEEIGTISFNVPCDMQLKTGNSDEPIELKRGVQNLEAEQIIPMLLFDDYSSAIHSKETVSADFMKTIFQKLTSPSSAGDALSTYMKYLSFFETTISETSLKNRMDMILSYSEYDKKVISYPGYVKVVENQKYYIPEVNQALKLFEDYK